MHFVYSILIYSFSFFFNDTAPTDIYTLSLHDALPIYPKKTRANVAHWIYQNEWIVAGARLGWWRRSDRKSTRLNSSHRCISYAVFCLKKKKKKKKKKKNINKKQNQKHKHEE